ncbi:hypothetical protein BKH43_04735 [Helicobacter sp. 13S00401-1]|nr:hypothetical protein BKH43_04735 [Helicobacter sp. 13S00401-1]
MIGEALLEPVSWCKKMETSKQKCERHFFQGNFVFKEAYALLETDQARPSPCYAEKGFLKKALVAYATTPVSRKLTLSRLRGAGRG